MSEKWACFGPKVWFSVHSKEHLSWCILFINCTSLLYLVGKSVLVLTHHVFIQWMKNLISILKCFKIKLFFSTYYFMQWIWIYNFLPIFDILDIVPDTYWNFQGKKTWSWWWEIVENGERLWQFLNNKASCWLYENLSI